MLLFIAFAVALTFIMLFIFNFIIRPSLFIRFSSQLNVWRSQNILWGVLFTSKRNVLILYRVGATVLIMLLFWVT